MKHRKQDNRQNTPRTTDFGAPLSGYSAFSGDPRLSRPIAELTAETQSPAKKKRSRLFTTVSTVLAVAAVLALPLVFLWNYLGEKPEEAPSLPPYEPPIYTPNNSSTERPTPSTPTTPTPSTPSTSTSSDWVPGGLALDINEFHAQYGFKYGTMTLGFGLYADGGKSTQKELTASEWINRCMPIILDNFQYRTYNVKFEGSQTSSILSFFLLDELEQLRRQTPAAEVAQEKECLLVVERAAARFGEACYIYRSTINSSSTAVRVKIRDEDIPDILGGFSAPQWITYSSSRSAAYDVLWTGFAKRSAIRSRFDGYAEQIAGELLLYLYGYTYKAYMNDGVDYYKDLNGDIDKTLMRKKQLELMDYIAERLPDFPERERATEDGYTYSVGIVPYFFYQSIIDMIPDIVNEFLGISYEEFLSSGAFLNAPYDGGLLRARYNQNGGNIVFGIPRLIDRNNLNDLLASITFEQGEITFTPIAEISYYQQVIPLESLDMRRYPLPVLTAGRGEDGNYYLQSGRYYAKLTRKQYSTFLVICTEGEIDNHTYAYERRELFQTKK
jgi:hypothetical protein